MKQIDLEGDFWGYKKKTLVFLISTLFIIAISFYGGAKYEKIKLGKLGLLVQKPSESKEKERKPKAEQPKQEEVQPKNEAISLNGKIISKNPAGILTILKNDGSKQDFTLGQQAKLCKEGGNLIPQLYVGQQITIDGVKNSDGSITAAEIRNPVASNSVILKK